MRKTILLAAVNVALMMVLLGCGESVPQKSAEGGILSGTEIERQRYNYRPNPLLAGNGPEQVGQPPAATPPAAPSVSMPGPYTHMTHVPAPTTSSSSPPPQQ